MSIGSITPQGFSEGAFTVEGYKEGLKNIGEYKQEDLYISYIRKQQEMDYIARCARIYILENWEKVDDWSELNIVITDIDGNETEFYNYETRIKHEFSEEAGSRVKEIFDRIDKEKREKHNPVESFDNVVLDPVDGDFSVTINGQDFLWLSDREIMKITGYIEYKLREQ